MKQFDSRDSSLLEWLSEQDACADELGEIDRSLYKLINDYIYLMEAIEYWGGEHGNRDDAFFRLVKNKELEIIKAISDNGRGSLIPN